jgi:hypothetical protein
MLSGHRLKADRAPEQRSAVTNRNALFLENVDERTPFARRFRDVLSLHISDLGGWDEVTEAQASLARRAATITVELERIECRLAEASESNDKLAGLYATLSNCLRRLLALLQGGEPGSPRSWHSLRRTLPASGITRPTCKLASEQRSELCLPTATNRGLFSDT